MAKKPRPQLPLLRLMECRSCHSVCWCFYPQICGPCKELQELLSELAKGDMSHEERGSLHTLLKGVRDLIVARRRGRSRSPTRSVDAPRAANLQQGAAGACSPAAPASEAGPQTPPELVGGQGIGRQTGSCPCPSRPPK